MPVRVLVVDNDELILELAWDTLSPEFEVILASTPQDALRSAAMEPFAIVCTDYDMPGMNGAQMLSELAQRMPAFHAVLLTGSDISEARGCKNASAIVTKPFRPSELIALVRALAKNDLAEATFLADRWGLERGKAIPFGGGSSSTTN